MSRTLVPGEIPAKGSTVELCHANYTHEPTVLEWFESDGSWVTPSTVQGHYYRATTREELEAAVREYVGGVS